VSCRRYCRLCITHKILIKQHQKIYYGGCHNTKIASLLRCMVGPFYKGGHLDLCSIFSSCYMTTPDNFPPSVTCMNMFSHDHASGTINLPSMFVVFVHAFIKSSMAFKQPTSSPFIFFPAAVIISLFRRLFVFVTPDGFRGGDCLLSGACCPAAREGEGRGEGEGEAPEEDWRLN